MLATIIIADLVILFVYYFISFRYKFIHAYKKQKLNAPGFTTILMVVSLSLICIIAIPIQWIITGEFKKMKSDLHLSGFEIIKHVLVVSLVKSDDYTNHLAVGMARKEKERKYRRTQAVITNQNSYYYSSLRKLRYAY